MNASLSSALFEIQARTEVARGGERTYWSRDLDLANRVQLSLSSASMIGL
jgi:hypothetical protein